MKQLRPFVIATLLGSALLPPVARAAPEPAAEDGKDGAAKAHYQKGALLYRQGDYAGAWLEFTSAYQILPRAELLFNMARCEVKLGRPAEALAHFESYLAAIPNDPDAGGLRKEMASLRIEVAEIKRREAQREQPQPPPKEEPKGRRPFPVYGTIAGAGTLLFGIIGAALLGSVSGRYGSLTQSCAPLCRPEEVHPLEQQANAGYVFLGLTAAGAVTTAALLAWELRRPAERPALTLRREAGGGGVALGWRF